MNREDIIRMAREAGYFLYDLTETHGTKTVETDEVDQWEQLERFAAFVASAEREACAKECDACICTAQASEAIRARGQA